MNNLHKIQVKNKDIPDFIKAWLWWFQRNYKCKYSKKAMWLWYDNKWLKRDIPNDTVNNGWYKNNKPEPDWASLEYEQSS